MLNFSCEHAEYLLLLAYKYAVQWIVCEFVTVGTIALKGLVMFCG